MENEKKYIDNKGAEIVEGIAYKIMRQIRNTNLVFQIVKMDHINSLLLIFKNFSKYVCLNLKR